MEAERQENRDRQRELEHLREVDQFKTTFLNTAAHELRTPLLPVKAQLFLLKRQLGATQDPEVQKTADMLDRNISRLGSLVEDLLDAARHQAGRIVLKLEDAQLDLLVDEAAAAFRQAAHDRGIVMDVRKRGVGALRMDRRRISQVLYNLLSNALKFTPDRGHITVEAVVDADGGHVAVSDTGLGLSQADLDRLFQPFAQLQESVIPGQRGSGLGLYISRGFIEAHGGRIWAESAGAGKGSRFSFSLPRSPPEPTTAGRPEGGPPSR
jgi:signal transduction histidine kinase